MTRNKTALAAGILAILAATPANAAEVTFSGVVANLCIISTTPGVIGAEGDGMTLSTEGLLGTAATVAVTATGGLPTLRFAAPTLSTPAGFIGTPTTNIAVYNGGTLIQPLTASTSTAVLGRLISTLSVRARVANADGFSSGVYAVRSIVTCEQQ